MTWFFHRSGLSWFESCKRGSRLSWYLSSWTLFHGSGDHLSHHLIIFFFEWDFYCYWEVIFLFLLYQEGIDALEEVIYHIETYDVTTVRASTPMFLMSRKIKSLGVKMVLSGEGSDEIFGGYLYFHKAPNKEEFHQETCRKVIYNNCYALLFDTTVMPHVISSFLVYFTCLFKFLMALMIWQIKALHLYDCLRANKSTSAWGIEARVPFLDKEFINTAMGMDPEWKMVFYLYFFLVFLLSCGITALVCLLIGLPVLLIEIVLNFLQNKFKCHLNFLLLFKCSSLLLFVILYREFVILHVASSPPSTLKARQFP